MIINEKDTHEARLLIIDQEEKFSCLEKKLIESIDNRYILKPMAGNADDGVFHFDISGYEAFSEYLVNRRLSRMEMISFLAQLKSVIMTLEDHMLSDANLLLEPSRIYIDKMNRKVRFTPVCQMEGGFGERLRPLTEIMFLHADLTDTDSLRFAALLLRTAMQPQVRLHDLMRLIENQRSTAAESGSSKAVISGPVYGSRPAVPETGKEEKAYKSMEFSSEEKTMRLAPEQEMPISGTFLRESPTQELEEQKEETGVKGFFSGLIAGIKEKLTGEE